MKNQRQQFTICLCARKGCHDGLQNLPILPEVGRLRIPLPDKVCVHTAHTCARKGCHDGSQNLPILPEVGRLRIPLPDKVCVHTFANYAHRVR